MAQPDSSPRRPGIPFEVPGGVLRLFRPFPRRPACGATWHSICRSLWASAPRRPSSERCCPPSRGARASHRIGLAALAAAPFLANFLSVFTGRLGPRTPRQLAVTRMVGAALLITLAFVPIPWMKIPVAIAFWISVAFGLPYQLRLWGTMYPGRIRGRIIGLIGTGRAAAAGIAALSGGLLADQVGGGGAVAVAGLLGIVCAAAAAGMRAPETGPVRPLLRHGIAARPAWSTGADARGACPGLLRRWTDRGGAALRAGLRRPAWPVAHRGRHDRHPGRRGRHRGLAHLGRGRRSQRRDDRHAHRQRAGRRLGRGLCLRAGHRLALDRGHPHRCRQRLDRHRVAVGHERADAAGGTSRGAGRAGTR